ncbi:nucleotide sugar dehydrogenase [Syntrophomonas palmitatica]|uniref:nucleotide sugar dehydrogenase n=1 Tax=Syntrophomonas palmitatica TaxID=402877 RepID=UPI000A92E068|nr:nucleotide sugar dehydrogenase [Syntrophomonas palmitatica]
MSRICVVGLGYIGLPTASLLAFYGHRVTGVDIDINILQQLGQGAIHIEEPNLNEVFQQVVKENKLVFRAEPKAADVFFIAVPTPILSDKSCDLTYVLQAVNSIIPHIKTGNIVILESTVPPGTCEEIIKPLLQSAGYTIGRDLYLAHCPERVLPGSIVEELVENNRIVGGCTPACAQIAADIFRSFVKGEILLTDSKTAEMTKLIENTYRDLNIALANELVLLCHRLGINPLKAIELANKHPRVNILNPGPGVGGHCLAVDPYFIIEKAPELARLISRARIVNNEMPEYVYNAVKRLLTGLNHPKIAVLGLSYKGNVGDLRESPALKIVTLLREAGYALSLYEPHADSLMWKTIFIWW